MEKQKFKSVKVKGTVLFTVVSVMMVLIVFVMATLTIASAASKRSYNTYFKNQALYSARSVVDTTVKELLAGGASNDLKKEATKLVSAGDELELSCDLPTGMGKVSDLKIEFAGIDKIGEPSFVTGSGDGIIKITATVEMGGQASTYSQYVLKSAAVTIPAISEGALVSMGKGMQSDATSPSIFGSTYSFNSDIDSENTEEVKGVWSQLRNDGSANALSYNSSVYINTSMNFSFDKGSGMYIGGHLSMQNVPTFTSKASKGETGLMYSEIPYIYVGGVFYQDNDSSMIVGSKNNPINIYCGSMHGRTGSMTLFTTYGDVYAYDSYDATKTEAVSADGLTHAPTGLTTFGSSSGTANLLKWVDSLVNSTDLNFASHTGGSFYSNGRLTISGNGSTFEGDVIVKDKVTINATGGDVIIGGSLYAGNGLEINTNKEITIEGGIFLGADNVSISTGAKINGIEYGGNPGAFIAAVNAAANAEKLNATQAKINAEPSTLFPKAMDKEYLFKGDMEIADPDERAKTITLVDSKTMLESFKTTVDGVTEYKDYKAEPEDDKVSYNVAYKSSDKNFTIDEPLTSNCTLVGQWNEDIYIKPNPGQSIWVTLYNFTLEGHRVIVDNTTHATNPGVVYFFVPEKGSVSYVAGEAGATFGRLVEILDGTGDCTGDLKLNGTGDGAGIVTSYYANLNEAIDLTLYPLTLEGGAEINRPKVPNIYIYMAGGKKAYGIESEVAPRLASDNKSVITGYICAPYITLEFLNPRGTGGSGASIKYNETVVTKDNIAVIGQVIVGDIEKFTNDNIVVQVSPNISGGGGPRPGEVIGGQWTELENTYGFGS